MKKTPSLITLGVTFLLIIVLVGYLSSLKVSSAYARPVGTLKIEQDAELQSNINIFMESDVDDYTMGKENYHCSNILYGYDDQYGYAWVFCAGYIMKSQNELEIGTTFSIPTRLEYTQPNFEIIAFQQPGDGALYAPTLQKLFPKKMYDLGHPSNAEIDALKDETQLNARAQLATIQEDLNGDGQSE